jgi:hypothetical protein
MGCCFLPTIESNDVECTEEGEVFEYQDEEDQGQANQGKPSELVAYLIPVLHIAWFITVYENALFYVAMALNSNCWRLGSASQMISSSRMTPILTPTYSPELVAWWIASWPLENLVVEQNSRLGTLNWDVWKWLRKPWNRKLFHWWIPKWDFENKVGMNIPELEASLVS